MDVMIGGELNGVTPMGRRWRSLLIRQGQLSAIWKRKWDMRIALWAEMEGCCVMGVSHAQDVPARRTVHVHINRVSNLKYRIGRRRMNCPEGEA